MNAQRHDMIDAMVTFIEAARPLVEHPATRMSEPDRRLHADLVQLFDRAEAILRPLPEIQVGRLLVAEEALNDLLADPTYEREGDWARLRPAED